MRMHRMGMILLALLLACCVCLPAAAESELQPLADQAVKLMLDTDNVTIKAHADFYLNGDRFKTADVLYIQDGTYSHWQLDLLTPRRLREDRETGFTIIANGSGYYIMERYHPGTYKSGADIEQDAIMRRTAEAEALASLAGSLAAAAEQQLPEGTLKVTREANGETEYALELKEDEVPFLLNASINLYAEFAIHRFLGVDYDEVYPDNPWTFENYGTITNAIVRGTRAVVISDTSGKIRTDAEGRLASMNGTVTVKLDMDERNPYLLEIRFDAAVSDYGASRVPTFDPDDFGVIPAEEAEGEFMRNPGPEKGQLFTDRATEIVRAAGYTPDGIDSHDFVEDDGFWYVYFRGNHPVFPDYIVVCAPDGKAVYFDHATDPCYMDSEHEFQETDATGLDAAQQEKLSTLMETLLPGSSSLAAAWIPVYEYRGANSRFLVLNAVDQEGENSLVRATVCIEPEWRIVNLDMLEMADH